MNAVTPLLDVVPPGRALRFEGCPVCQHALNVSVALASGQIIQPRGGELVICVYCSAILETVVAAPELRAGDVLTRPRITLEIIDPMKLPPSVYAQLKAALDEVTGLRELALAGETGGGR